MEGEKIPEVTVMIPCYNTGEAVRETLESIIAQTYSDWEIVAVDDASSDNTPAILDEYAQRFPGKIRVVHNKYEDGKKHNSFNVGWQHSRGRWVVDLGHDDLLSSDFIQMALKRIEETEADAIVPVVVHFKEAKELSGLRRPCPGLSGDPSAVISGREAVILSLDWQINSFCLWRGDIARSTHIDEADTPYDWGELESRRRFLQCGKVAFSSGEYQYRYNSTSITHVKWGRNSHKRLITNREILSELTRHHFPKQVIDSYRVQTYRLFCASFSRFFVSNLFWHNPEDRREVLRELRSYYQDAKILDRKELIRLLPNLLDMIRLYVFWAVIPITFWRKLINRFLKNTTIF